MSTMLNNLIVDAYKLSKSHNLIGIIYGSNIIKGFNDILEDDLIKLLDNIKIDMLYLKSLPTSNEIQIYESELKNYTIKKSEETLYVLTKDGETALMY